MAIYLNNNTIEIFIFNFGNIYLYWAWISFAEPNFNENYRAKLPLFGTVGQNGLSVALNQASSDLFPNNYFTLESVSNSGIYVRLINALDRDVSTYIN
jgi:hypothetical protein